MKYVKQIQLGNMNKIRDIANIDEMAKYYDMIKEHALILTKNNRILAEDCVQNVFIQIHNYLTKYPDKRINGGLISVSLRNLIRNSQSRRGRYIPVGDSTEVRLEGFDELVLDEDMGDEIMKEIDNIFNLPEDKREELIEMLTRTANQLKHERYPNLSLAHIRDKKRKFIEQLKQDIKNNKL